MAYGHLNGTGDKMWGKCDVPVKKGVGTLKTGTEKLKSAAKKVKPVNLAKVKGLG